jgi:hypothetical protein
MILRTAARRIAHPVQREYRDWMLKRTLASLQDRLRRGLPASAAHLARLRHFWSNDAWSAQTDFLQSMLRWLPRTSGTILECGSGLSTVLLAAGADGRRIVSLENNLDWAARVRSALPYEPRSQVEITVSPIRAYGEFDWYSVGAIEQLTPVGFVVCDGPPGQTRGGRYGLAPVLKSTLAPGCVVMLDDTGRPEERAIVARWLTELSADLVEDSDLFCVLRVRGGLSS